MWHRKNNDIRWFSIRGVYKVEISNRRHFERGLETPGYWIELALIEDSTGTTWYGPNLHLFHGKLRGTIYARSNGYKRHASHYCEFDASCPARQSLRRVTPGPGRARIVL